MMKLRSDDDPLFKVDFHADLSTLEYICKDVMVLKRIILIR
jgi:hypothetical protein